jgi:hypothetical protein
MPGPPIPVEPFDSRNVSTPAALIKLGTSISASRRQRANFQAAQQDLELQREKTRAEIAAIRANAAYSMGEGRQSGNTATTLGSDIGPYKAGALLTDVTVDLAHRRLTASEKGGGAGSARVTNATAALKQLDDAAEAEAQTATQEQMRKYELALRARVISVDPKVSGQAAWSLGLNPDEFNRPYAAGGPTDSQRAEMIEAAFKSLGAKTLARMRAQAQPKYDAQRKQYRAIIDQGALGQGADGQTEGDPNDPLGLGQFEGELNQGAEVVPGVAAPPAETDQAQDPEPTAAPPVAAEPAARLNYMRPGAADTAFIASGGQGGPVRAQPPTYGRGNSFERDFGKILAAATRGPDNAKGAAARRPALELLGVNPDDFEAAMPAERAALIASVRSRAVAKIRSTFRGP